MNCTIHGANDFDWTACANAAHVACNDNDVSVIYESILPCLHAIPPCTAGKEQTFVDEINLCSKAWASPDGLTQNCTSAIAPPMLSAIPNS
jgi:hypothetical protein